LRAAQNGVWQTNGRDDGAVLMGDFGGAYLPIQRKDGSRIEIKFDQLPAAQMSYKADSVLDNSVVAQNK